MNKIRPVVTFHVGEPVGSYCSRTAAAYGLRSASEFAELFKFSFRGLLSGQPCDMETFAEITGVPLERLKSAIVIQMGEKVYVGGHPFARRFVDPLRCRLCPNCVVDSLGPFQNLARPYARAGWLLKSMRCCPIHDCELLRFPGLTWWNSADFAGLVRENFTAIKRAATSSASVRSSAFERYITSRVNLEYDKEMWLDTLPLQTAIHFTEVLGAVIRHGNEPDLEALAVTQWVDAAREGIAVTGSGVEAIREILRDIGNVQTRRRRSPLTVLFGRLAAELLEYENDPGYVEIISVMKEVALDIGRDSLLKS